MKGFLNHGTDPGEQVFQLAEVLPNATFTGVDISGANVQAAEDVRHRHPSGERMIFRAMDYMDLRDDPFDLIFSWGVLHLIQAPTQELFSKIAGDLTADGILLYAMPYWCPHNRALSLGRGLLQRMRSPITDAIILRVSKYLYGGEFKEDFLRERVHYMYCVPERYDCDPLRQFLHTAYGLDLVGEHPDPRISPFQFRYRLTACRKSSRL